MGGLALCSATEAKFNIDGFLLALATNISEWCVKLKNHFTLFKILKQFAERSFKENVEHASSSVKSWRNSIFDCSSFPNDPIANFDPFRHCSRLD